MQVTRGLCSALRRLRKASQERVVWIDQLCINQTDDEEKSLQVKLMAIIYKSAMQVFIWLGDDEETVENGFMGKSLTIEEAQTQRDPSCPDLQWDSVSSVRMKVQSRTELSNWERILAAIDFIYLNASNRHGHETPYFYTEDISKQNHVFPGLRQGLGLLINRAWWYRVWVVQETVLAPRAMIILGSLAIPWKTFEIAARNYFAHVKYCCRNTSGSLPHSESNEVLRLFGYIMSIATTRAFNSRPPGENLMHLLWQYRTRQATDDRDKVFAMLGLVRNWAGGHPMVPNYSLSTIEVYCQVVKEHRKSTSTLHSLVNFRPGRPEFPTWLPDWAANESSPNWSHTTYVPSFVEHFRAWNWYTNAQIHENRLFSVDGIFVDTVCAVGEVNALLDWSETAKIIQQWRDMAHLDEEPEREYLHGETREEAFSRTVIGDMFCYNTTLDLRRRLLGGWRSFEFWTAIFEAIRAYCNTIINILPFRNAASAINITNKYRRARKEDWQTFPSWWSRMKIIEPDRCDWVDPETDPSFGYTLTVPLRCTNKRYFLTSEGYMGIGPARTSIGDKVFVLKGGFVPFLLRTAGSREVYGLCLETLYFQCFTMVGDCYCHGIMDGEALQRWPERESIIWLV
jgi:Heterokaryon incompatibility protein (HET)